MTGKWYIKTHESEELGPFDYSALLDLLSAPPYSENATLIRPEWRDSWKPALIEIPSLMENDDSAPTETPVPAVAITEESSVSGSPYIHIRRSRWALLPLAIISLIGMTALFLKLLDLPSGYSPSEPLADSNRAMFCTVLFIFPLGALWKMAFASFQLHLSEIRYVELFLTHMERFYYTLLFAVAVTIGAYLITSFG